MSGPSPLALITGGAGFIATNVAARLLREGWRVRLLDNFSRPGVAINVGWLKQQSGAERLEVVFGDVRDAESVHQAVFDTTRVFHFAARFP